MILPGCQFYILLELNTGNRFVCTRVFAIDAVRKVKKWSGSYVLKGDHLLLDSDFYFKHSKVVLRSRSGFKIKMAPGTSNPIFLSKLNKKESESYHVDGDGSSGV